MRILVLANFQLGLYRFRREILRELKRRGHDVYVAVPEDKYTEELEETGAVILPDRFLDRRGVNPVKDFRLYRFYKQLIKELNPDAVLSFTIKPNVYGGYACRRAHVPYISCVTGLGSSIQGGGILKFISLRLYRMGLKGAGKVFFENTSNRDFMVSNGIVSNDKTAVVSGAGVNLDDNPYEPYPNSDKPIVFSTIGRVMKDKGIDELLEAAEAIKKSRDDVVFRLVGDFDDDYEEVIKEKDTGGIIQYIGLTMDVHSIMKESHAIVHPSYHEGMSNVLLEAAATGRPLIASNVPGCKEAYDEGASGIGFDIKSATSLEKAIEKFLSMPREKWEEMGKLGRKKMESEFDRKIVAKAYADALEAIR